MISQLLVAASAARLEPITWTIVVVGIGIVFLSLVLVYLFFRYVLTFILNFRFRSFARKKGIDPTEVHTVRGSKCRYRHGSLLILQ